uniref:Ferric uptake regulator, Fur family n=1 Tax=Cyanothece sp. (strain PCC 7425 / ATCC 29141) TaxID=395961 RepID=B8HQH7_CYAP4
MAQQNTIIQMLKEKGLRVTPQRFAVYANLLNRCDHPTAEQLLQDLNETAPTSSQATVYTSLQALCEVGLVREVLLEEGVRRYDANITPHHHFRCRCCGRIQDVPWQGLQELVIGQVLPGVQVESYEVTLRGCCEQCQSN